MLENDGRVVSNFISQALRGNPLTIYGDGSQTRSFCYVENMVDGLIKLMESDCSGPINLGNPEEYTVLELAQKIRDKLNPKQEIIFKPLPQDDPRQRKPDITKAQKWLNWQPTISLEDGLAKTIMEFKKRIEISEERQEKIEPITAS
jgi:UDP-glucuronate decarboxylase